MSYERDSAETLGLQALAWLVGQEELIGVFLGASGASESDLRERAGEADFLGSVLDFILMDDEWVVRFCDSQKIPYDRVMMARAALPGGEQVHWT